MKLSNLIVDSFIQKFLHLLLLFLSLPKRKPGIIKISLREDCFQEYSGCRKTAQQNLRLIRCQNPFVRVGKVPL